MALPGQATPKPVSTIGLGPARLAGHYTAPGHQGVPAAHPVATEARAL